MNAQYKKGFVYFICLVSAMGGLLFGYDWVVIGGAKPFYEPYFGITDDNTMRAVAMSVALLGCLVGAMIAGVLADKYGRKRLLIVAALVFFFSSLSTGMADYFVIFVISRFIGGIAIGLAADVSPMYIAEIAPRSVRGKLVSLNQLTTVLGILSAQIVNMLIAESVAPDATVADIAVSWNGTMGWRWMFYAVCFPSFLFFVLVFFIPESPRWLIQKGNERQAMIALERIGNREYALAECAGYRESDTEAKKHGKGAVKQLFSKKMRLVLSIGLVIAVFQQWCGINVIFNYAQEIFTSAGYTISDMFFNIIVTGSANLIFTVIAIFTVDKLGRRALMRFGALSLTLIYLVMGCCYFFEIQGFLLLLLVVLAIACYAVSLGAVVWVILAEIFPTRVRGTAVAISTFALWAACFILTYTFPILNNSLGADGTFWLYGAICLAGYLFITFRLPETKQKSLEEIEKELLK